jgi:ribose 5-phosphate isomerase A
LGRVVNSDEAKRRAAAAAVEMITPGMVVGLGSGTTSAIFVELLAERVKEGLRVRGVPTSLATAEAARRLGIPVTDPISGVSIDLVVDGADEVDGGLCMIKGLGGALVREKIVARAARRVVIIVDESKLVEKLGTRSPVPVEVVRFGWSLTADRLRRLGCTPALREEGSAPVTSDNGNYIVDCDFGAISEPERVEREIVSIPGVVEAGLFCGIADVVLVGSEDGVRSLKRT